MPKSDPTIGQIAETGDRGIPALAVGSDGKYAPNMINPAR